MPLAITFYGVVLALHIAAIVVAFGITFTYPLMERLYANNHPRSMGSYHRVQATIGQRIIAPSGGVALLAGIYLASKGHYWDKIWVTIPLIILVGLLAAGGLFFGPNEEKAADLADRDIAASPGDGPVNFSPEYKAVRARVAQVGMAASLLVLVAIFFMAAKPGGY
jgi:hypothetical protein